MDSEKIGDIYIIAQENRVKLNYNNHPHQAVNMRVENNIIRSGKIDRG